MPDSTRTGATRRFLLLPALGLCAASLCIAGGAAAQITTPLRVEIEAGPVWQLSNTAHAPPDSMGTRFSVFDLTGAGPRTAWRASVDVDIDRRHGLRVVLAPLSLAENTMLADSVDFAGQRFDPGVQTWARYASSFFRIAYRYRVLASPGADLRIGLAGQIRDGTVTLEQPGLNRTRNDLGFMPLLHLDGAVQLRPRVRVTGEADALAIGDGRTIDAAAHLRFDLAERWSLAAGYRFLESAFNTMQIESEARFNSVVAALAYRF